MVSVPSPSYLPPLAFEPFALSEPHPLTLTVPSTPPPTASTHAAPPSAYSHHPSQRIRGPRVRPKLTLANGTYAPVVVAGGASQASVDASGGSLRRQLTRESTSRRASRNPILAKQHPFPPNEAPERPATDRNASVERRSQWAVRPGTAPDLSPLNSRRGGPSSAGAHSSVDGAVQGADRPAPRRTGMGPDLRRAAVPFDVSHLDMFQAQKPRTAPPAVGGAGLDGDAAGIDVDLSHDDLFKFKVSADDPAHPHSRLAPPAPFVHDELSPTSRPDSFASDRPPSALPGATIDELEHIAVELRTMQPHSSPPSQETFPRARRPAGPRPRSPPCSTSSHVQRSVIGSTYSSTDMLEIVDEADPSGNAGGRSNSPRPIREDVEWVADYGLWCSSAKGKWKVPWVETEADEINTTHTSHEAETDSEPYFTYDPQTAPEFLVGKSTSLTVTAAPGFHSGRRLPRLRTARRQHGRNNRPPGLVLAPGSQPDPPTPDDPDPRAPSLPVPPHSAPASHSHFHTKPHKPPPDLRGLELLIGPLEPRTKPKPPPKPKTPASSPPVMNGFASREGPMKLAPVRGDARVDLIPRSTAASWSSATPNTPRNSFTRPARQRRNMFTSLRRWFRRLTAR
ncbi:uncharacterized protein C8Q71DRAFT_459035 [Rhodofomes roseus]|uniref:Uncharacterized protein n=1 Tax=Rhodofomes roseus TaxID=34475 RepID=A0ABQ8KNH0_9APHY|nr:uncharacterized protein C8Q71DRAFT_459035 [Rhodofomes roseus]KAH9839695.1 hypothetical protein C8Q71DRAFT_459035 [Rhodofomes roseus]